MIRTGQEYRDSIRDGRRIWVNGERVNDVTTHPQFKPLVDIRARIFDMQHEEAHRDIMTEEQDGERNALGSALPRTQDDWWAKRRATDHMLNEIGGVVTRVGDETVGEMWSLFDGQDVLNEVDPQFSKNIETHIHRVLREDPFHVSANTDPKGDRGHHRSRREIRDGGRLCQSGLHEADDCQLGQQCPQRLRRGLHLRSRQREPEVHLPHRLRRPCSGKGLPAGQQVR
jgi:aromatic ring hydroxylase